MSIQVHSFGINKKLKNYSNFFLISLYGRLWLHQKIYLQVSTIFKSKKYSAAVSLK